MKSKQIFFFGDKLDLLPILEAVESATKIHCFQSGMFDSPSFPNYNSLTEIPHLGSAVNGDWNQNDLYFILPKNIDLNVIKVPQRVGGVKYTADQISNPNSCMLLIGGVLKEGILVGGKIATISNDPFSSEIFKLFSDEIKAHFKRVGSFYVGKNAEVKLDIGWRLVTNDKSPIEYDLKKK